MTSHKRVPEVIILPCSARPAASIVVDELRAQLGREAPQRVRGPGCANCARLKATAAEALEALGVEATLEYVTEGEIGRTVAGDGGLMRRC